MIEEGVGHRLKVVARSIAGAIYRIDGTRDVLRVIEQVPGTRADRQGIAFSQRESLVQGEVPVIDRANRQRVPPPVRQRTYVGLDIVCVRRGEETSRRE